MAHTPLDELKARARIALNAARQGSAPDAKLRHSLNAAARHAGFAHWDHARAVLGGHAQPGDDFGTFWHAPGAGILLNHWFAAYGEARAIHAQIVDGYLLPYKQQFMLVQSDFITAIGMDSLDPAWSEIGRDAVAGYASAAWARLAGQRLAALREP